MKYKYKFVFCVIDLTLGDDEEDDATKLFCYFFAKSDEEAIQKAKRKILATRRGEHRYGDTEFSYFEQLFRVVRIQNGKEELVLIE